MSIILASKSAARAALLRAAGVPFEVRGSGVDEDPLKATWLADGADPHTIASRLAEEKAHAISHASENLVIGADQTLDLDGRLIDKPADIAEARARLLEFRGRPHRLHSAVVLARGGRVIWRDTPTATLHVRHFTEAWLDDYLAQAGASVLQTVGGYELEGRGVQLFEAIEGDWFAILGLPMIGLLHALRREGVLAR